jgi:hypothetical protein
MTKLVVETTGQFQLIGLRRSEFIRAHRPSVVPDTGFVDPHVVGKRVTLLGRVEDTATDEALEKHLKSGGKVEAFVEAHSKPKVPESEPEASAPKRR